MCLVSIHVPTRGTTFLEYPFIKFYPVSIHVPTRGTTNAPNGTGLLLSGFNPRAHTGHDVVDDRIGRKRFVSIHVPTRGTTPASKISPASEIVSIHVPTRGTTLPDSAHAPAPKFQSTCPHGARQNVKGKFNLIDRFQSTCPHGARHETAPLYGSSLFVSIHVPTRGTTNFLCCLFGYINKFQSTCPHGARLYTCRAGWTLL